MTINFCIHPTAVIDPQAIICKNTWIWHYSHVMDRAYIGPDCVLGQNVHVAENVIIGAGCKIQNNVSLFKGVVLEDDVFIGPSAVFTNVNTPRAFINRKAEFEPTIVHKGATIGANATIICGVEIGYYAMIGAGSVVTKDVPDFALVYGVPAKLRGTVCICGTRLLQLPDTPCPRCGLTFKQCIEQAEALKPKDII